MSMHKESEKLESDSISIVVGNSLDTPHELIAAEESRQTENSIEKEIVGSKYWAIVEYSMAFVAPFFMETFIIWFLTKFVPLQHSDCFAVNKIETVFLYLAAIRLVPPIIGLALAVSISRTKISNPMHMFYLWLLLILVFVVNWVLYCRQISPYWF